MKKESFHWAAVETPSGNASRVPVLLAGLADTDAKARARSVAALRKLAIFEGDVTTVAVPLAPLLVDVARDTDAPALADVLLLLADLLVCGSADLWINKGYEVRTPAFEAAAPDQYGRALYEIIAAPTSDYLRLLKHEDATVRGHLGPLLAYLSRETATIEPALLAHLGKEKDGAVQASLAIALAHQGRYAEDARATKALEELLVKGDATARIGAAAGLAVSPGARESADVGAVLLEAAKKQRKKISAMPWFGGVLANLAVVVGARLAEARQDVPFAEKLVAAAVKLPTHFWAMGALIHAAFAHDARPTPRAPGELDDSQRRIVAQIAASEEIARLSATLERAGLIADDKALSCLAGKGPSTTLSKVANGEPLLRLLARGLRTTADEDVWRAALVALKDADRLKAVQDALDHPLRGWRLPRPSDRAPERDDFVVDDRSSYAMQTRAIEVAADDLATCSLPLLTAAVGALVKEKQRNPAYLAALVLATCEVAARAGKEPPPGVDELFKKINPGNAFDAVDRVRSALEKLPMQRREAIVLERNYWHRSPPEGGAAAAGGAWRIGDLAPSAAVASAAVEEIVSWDGAEPPYPEDFAVDFLRRLGAVARPIIEAALKLHPKCADVLRRALDKPS